MAIVAYLVAWGVTSISVFAIHRIWRRAQSPPSRSSSRCGHFALRIYLAIWVFAVGGIFLGVSVIARQLLGYPTEIIAWLALGWFLWRIVDALGEISIERLSRRNQFGMLSAIRFLRSRRQISHCRRGRDRGSRLSRFRRDRRARRSWHRRDRHCARCAEDGRKLRRQPHLDRRPARACRRFLPFRADSWNHRRHRDAVNAHSHLGPHGRHGAQRRIFLVSDRKFQSPR